jgi:hypothetical protein
MQKQFSADAKNSQQSNEGDRNELTQLPLPRQNLLLQLLPCQPWRIQQSGLCLAVPDSQQPFFRALNNLFEFLAAIIMPWIDIIGGRCSPGDCALLMTDSTTAKE